MTRTGSTPSGDNRTSDDAPSASDGATGSGREIFVFGMRAWDITAGLELVAGRPPTPADITGLAGLASLVRVNPAQVAVADLSRPILIAPIPGTVANLVIDGWHRIHRALADGVTHLPAWLLSDDEARQIRITRP